MPYYLHAKDSEPITGEIFLTRQDALPAFNPREDKITFIASEDEIYEWRSREKNRFTSGEYVRVPWHNKLPYGHKTLDHFAHISVKSPGLIAYTKSDENGVQDRQTSVRPGRYLEEFCKDVFDREQIAEYIAQCDASHLQLKIARTPDDVEQVYINGPRSCMAHSGSARECIVCKREGNSGYHYTYESNEHPSRVYGNSDLSIAYYGDISGPSARAVVWPDKKIYSSRVYGSESVLVRLLEANGYTEGSFSNAKIRAIEQDGTYILPYLDGVSSATVERINGKTWIVLDSSTSRYSGSLDTTSTTGLGAEREEDHSDEFCCDACGDWTHEDNFGGNGMCQSCYDARHRTCESCSDTELIDRMTCADNGNYYCDSCYSENSQECSVCETEFNTLDFSRSENRSREINGTSALCTECADTHAHCSECDEYYEVNPAPQSAPRADFPGEHTVIDGIRAVDFVIPDADYSCKCSECNRTIRPEGMADLFGTSYRRVYDIAYESHCCPVDIRTIAPEPTQTAVQPISDNAPVFPLAFYSVGPVFVWKYENTGHRFAHWEYVSMREDWARSAINA